MKLYNQRDIDFAFKLAQIGSIEVLSGQIVFRPKPSEHPSNIDFPQGLPANWSIQYIGNAPFSLTFDVDITT